MAISSPPSPPLDIIKGTFYIIDIIINLFSTIHDNGHLRFILLMYFGTVTFFEAYTGNNVDAEPIEAE